MHNISYLQAMTHTYSTVFFFGGDECGLKILSQSPIIKAKNAYLSNSINYILWQKHMDRRKFKKWLTKVSLVKGKPYFIKQYAIKTYRGVDVQRCKLLISASDGRWSH